MTAERKPGRGAVQAASGGQRSIFSPASYLLTWTKSGPLRRPRSGRMDRADLSGPGGCPPSAFDRSFAMTDATPAPAAVIDPLTRFAIRRGTDKWGLHFYTPVYHALFRRMRQKPVRLLEIGIGGYGFKKIGGASLAMWADYFPNGQITGFDIEAKELDLGPRVTLRR